MLTLSDITRQVARLVLPDMMMTGTATAGAATSLTDSNNMTQPDQWWDKGTVWLLSGTHQGKLATITGHRGNQITFATFTTSVGTCRYAVARAIYPYERIKGAIMQALDDTHIDSEDATLEGDGETLEFTLPAGVYDVKEVWIENPNDATANFKSSHWKERNGILRFDYGYPPDDGWTIRVRYRDQHSELVDYDDEVDAVIDTDWLRFSAARYLLDWGMGVYKAQAEYRIEERMNLVLERLKTLTPRRDAPDVMIRSAGG